MFLIVALAASVLALVARVRMKVSISGHQASMVFFSRRTARGLVAQTMHVPTLVVMPCSVRPAQAARPPFCYGRITCNRFIPRGLRAAAGSFAAFEPWALL